MKNYSQIPFVSVIIPCFNHESFLEDAVISVLKSTYQESEIIIMDDGSSDGSFLKAKELAEVYPDRIKVFSQENAGPSVARNHAIDLARGKYILPLDADDKIGRKYLEEGIRILESDREIKLVYCEAEKFGLKTGHWKLRPFCPESLAKDNMIFVSAMFRKEDWAAAGGFDERLKWGWEDWEFWISMLKNGGKVQKLSCIGFYYRIHSISRRKSVTKQTKKMTLDLLNEKHAVFLKKYLDGPIRNPRSWSKTINRVLPYFSLLSNYRLRDNIHSLIFDKK
ncbi:glycosyltransferase family A protein [Algoriphagus antarcticus]|uniref:Glycosyltransferase involved in cell wall biosynthesis n=1 Tax=Algoriphagus antarcticus TaxID=238540 RepID=A0A3E0E7Q2_9BACT|nr:glycosyltransferase family A protein [Algoriphagus antarcticus]REG94294.1 glycosyltransferase involved in cell wall biosynthesis [Algoriphagus antarcticus]